MTTVCDPILESGILGLNAFLASGSLVQNADGSVWAGWGASESSARAVPGRLSVYAPDFFLREARPWRSFEHSALLESETLLRILDRVASAPMPSTWQLSPFEEFAATFEDLQRRIAEGSLVKAVPFAVRTARVEFDAPALAAILANALRRAQNSSLRAYGIWDAESGMIGTTPETLFEECERGGAPPFLRTMALAGTRTLEAPSLLDDPKECHEHRVVVDGIVEQLAPLGRVEVGTTAEYRLPTLVHLHTPIAAYPERPVAFEEWVTALHPTAAIGAWPKAEGWRWLSERPNAEARGRYGAPFGVVPPDAETGTCLVAIRNVQWQGGEARLMAGGGIVRESRVEREWREFNAKMDSIQGALGL